jgi:hypothetical protein
MNPTLSEQSVNPDGTMTATSSPAQSAPWIAAPWKLTRLSDPIKDEQLKRYTLLFQSLAALATIIVVVYGFTRKSN